MISIFLCFFSAGENENNVVGFYRRERSLLDDIAAGPFDDSPPFVNPPNPFANSTNPFVDSPNPFQNSSNPFQNSPFPFENSYSPIPLAAERTRRNDPLNGFKKYTNGWDIRNHHYWAVSFADLCGTLLLPIHISCLMTVNFESLDLKKKKNPSSILDIFFSLKNKGEKEKHLYNFQPE